MSRDTSMDALRGFAAVFVVLLHSTAIYMYDNVGALSWNVATILNGCTRWTVPIFVMISGAFLLQKEISQKELWTKRIFHLAYILIVWNLIYFLFAHRTFPQGPEGYVFPAAYHLWFLYMLIGVYAVIPFLKAIIKAKLELYLLAMWFVSEICLHFVGRNGDALINLFNLLNFKYVGYFVLGYYLYNRIGDFSILTRKLIAIIGILSMIVMITLTMVRSYAENELAVRFTDNLNIYVLLTSIAVFTSFKQGGGKFQLFNIKLSCISYISKYSLGIYLTHVMYLNIIIIKKNFMLTGNAVLDMLSSWILTLIASYITTAIMYRIPYLRKLVQ